MAKVKNLEDLKEKFKDGEPMKGKKNPKPAWKITSRHVMINLFFNILGEYTNLKNKLPSIDAEALSKMKSPIADQLIKFRQDSKTLKSLESVEKFVRPSEMFGFDNFTETKAIVNFSPISYNNVERAFTVAKESIPLNADKRVRKAFITPPQEDISLEQIGPKSLAILRQITDANSFPRYIWAGFDWSQAELQFLASYSKDQALKEALLSQDFHKYVAGLVFGKSIDQVSPEERDISKTVSFSLIYSGFNLETAKSSVLKKRPQTDPQVLDEALERYQQEFHALFEWVQEDLFKWYDNLGVVTYFMGAKKLIKPPDYLKRDIDKMLSNKEARVAINTYGQNSVGLLLKMVYSRMFRDKKVFEHTLQHIPVFDSMNFLVETPYLVDVIEKVESYATPNLIHDNFEIRMRTDWKLSTKSWGDMQDIEIEKKPILDTYKW